LGSRTQLHLELPGEADRGIAELPRLPAGIGPGSRVALGFPVADTMVFPAA
ncbi:MAG: TOBE domain-containing protein, partial [Acetobacteraceae bacterium]